jgi:regulator of extracellular matrix RemA (YlzA/DUF370 family)
VDRTRGKRGKTVVVVESVVIEAVVPEAVVEEVVGAARGSKMVESKG